MYFGATASITVLERLAHQDPDTLPDDLMLGRFEAGLTVDHLEAGFPIRDIGRTQARGEAFLAARTACILQVPSVLVPEESNFLMNPRHAEVLRIQPVEARSFEFDERLLL